MARFAALTSTLQGILRTSMKAVADRGGPL